VKEIARIVRKSGVEAVYFFDNEELSCENGRRIPLANLHDCTILTDERRLIDAAKSLTNVDILPMDRTLAPPIRAESFSSINTFHTCPKQYEHLYVLKDVKSIPGEAALWGTEVHRQLEEYIANGTPVTDPAAMRGVVFVDQARKGAPGWSEYAEHKWGLTEDFKTTGFSDNDCLLRGVIDFLRVGDGKALIVDWKTGKKKDNTDQMDIFALAAFHTFPEVKKIRGIYVWLKEGESPTMKDYLRSDLDRLKEEVLEKLEPIQMAAETGEYPMKMSGLCRGWCPVKTCPAYQER